PRSIVSLACTAPLLKVSLAFSKVSRAFSAIASPPDSFSKCLCCSSDFGSAFRSVPLLRRGPALGGSLVPEPPRAQLICQVPVSRVVRPSFVFCGGNGLVSYRHSRLSLF